MKIPRRFLLGRHGQLSSAERHRLAGARGPKIHRSSAPAEGTTSSVELQPAAGGGDGLRDPKGRTALSSILSPILCPVRPVAHPPEALHAWATRPAIPAESHDTLSQAVRRQRRRNQAREDCSPPLASNCATLRVARVQPNPRPNSPPRVRLTAAPLSLRRVSHFSRALAEILLEPFTMVLTISCSSSRARSSFAPDRTGLGPAGPHVPWTGNATHFHRSAQPNFRTVLCSRALGDSFYFGLRRNS